MLDPVCYHMFITENNLNPNYGIGFYFYCFALNEACAAVLILCDPKMRYEISDFQISYLC